MFTEPTLRFGTNNDDARSPDFSARFQFGDSIVAFIKFRLDNRGACAMRCS